MGKQVSLAQWSEHLEAAARQGETVVSYARRHGLSLSGMYSARYTLKQRQALVVKARAPAPPRGFVPVVVVPSRRQLTARLPNGVELSLEDADPGTVAGWLAALARLPCGA